MDLTSNLSGLKKYLKNWLKLLKGIRPEVNFEDLPNPAPPNYFELKYWASHPEIIDKADMVPKGYSEEKISDKANVFFIHPTTYFGKSNWNADLNHAQSNELLDEIVLPAQVSIFNQCCETYAPRYRQATFYTFLSGGTNAKKALDLAYEDVKAAFEHFIQQYNKDKPFFIAGHSQGSLLGLRLLEECIDQTPLRDKLVAAYLPGYKIPEHKFDRAFKYIIKGEKPTSIHCLVSWDTFESGTSIGAQLDNSLTWATNKDGVSSWKKRFGYKCFGVNPISFDSSKTTCESTENLGAVINEFNRARNLEWTELSDDNPIGITTESLSKPIVGMVSSRVKDGIVYISKPHSGIWRIGALPFGNYHVYDYNLFYMNIRRNVLQRWKHFQKTYNLENEEQSNST